jgi:thiol-disulfide isomerase/thioredoxin
MIATLSRSTGAIVFSAALVCCSLTACPAGGQETGEQLLPANPAMWLNSPPLNTETLKGKGVVLWFYEEQCPSCRKKWPDMYAVAKKFEGEPVVFIAVNSGNPRDEVEQYAKGVSLPWPVIVDPTREFEKQWLDKEISLQNIHQLGIILPSGRKTMGDWSKFEDSVQKAAEGATWKIDPKTIPVAFQPTWRLVEMGKYSAAAGMVKKGLVTKNEEVKQAATRVNAFVQEELKTAADRAAKLREQGDAWQAYRAYSELAANFAGYELPPEATAAQKELAADEQVKNQLDGAKTLESIKKTFPPRTDLAKKRIVRRLEQLIEQFPGTEAAAEAKSILDQAAAQE